MVQTFLAEHLSLIASLSLYLFLYHMISEIVIILHYHLLLLSQLTWWITVSNLIRLDLTFSDNLLSQFVHSPSVAHEQVVKRILRYVKGTLNFGIRSLSQSHLILYIFSDADQAGCLDIGVPRPAIACSLGPTVFN